MESHVVFRHLQSRERIFGLELADLFAIVLVFGLTLMFSKGLLASIGVCVVSYLAVFFTKRGKPSGWTQSWVSYHLRPKCYRGGAAGA